jgi:hypothetical protein
MITEKQLLDVKKSELEVDKWLELQIKKLAPPEFIVR